jgi:hypothetical protein
MLETLTAIFNPVVPTLLAKAANTVTEKRLACALEDSDERRRAREAYHQAMEEWLIALVRNFRSLDYDDDEIGAFFADYMEALPRFLADEEASEELLRPFTGPKPDPRLDAERLLARWQALGLPALPEDFNAPGACSAYVRALNRKRIITPKLRSLFQAQTAHGSHQVLQDIRGPWPNFDLGQYARAVHSRYQTLDLSALAPAGRDDPDERIRLRDVFIPQDARRSRLVQSLPRDYLVRHGIDPEEDAVQVQLLMQKWSQAKREPVLDLIAADEAKGCVVLGDPGAGKSVITRYLLLSLLDESSPEPPPWREKLSGLLPFLIELREFIAREDEGKCSGFLEYLHYLGAHQGFGLNVTELQQILRDRLSLVMFDGLDEIFDPTLRERIAREITGFMLEYEPARVLVTSRIAGFNSRPFNEAEFAVFTLDELDDDQIKTFVDGWFKVAYPSHPDEAEGRRKHVLETLRERPAIRALAGNPLLLTIIAIIARHQQLPQSRKDLYAHALNVMCHNWDFRRHLELKDSPLRNLEADHKLALLRRIAWRMQEGEGLKANAIEKSVLEIEIQGYFEDEWRFDHATCIRCSREMIDVLQSRNNILCPYGPGLYGFIHRTFLEYLCAAAIIWRFEKDRSLSIEEIRDGYVLRHCREDAWHEVIRLLTAQLQPKFAGNLIAALVPARVEASRQDTRLQLAFQCLAEREPRELTQLAPLCNSLLDALYAWFEAPGFGDRALKQRFANHVGAALKTVGANWPDPALGRRGLPRVPCARTNEDVYISLIASLAGSIWLKLPETAPLLRDHARKDENLSMRFAAFQILAEHFRDVPETEPLLRDRARNGESAIVRQAAMKALDEHFRDAQETKPFLLDCARNHKHEDVRYTAIKALAEHFRDAPETEPLLLERLREDEDAYVRRAALLAWAQAYSNGRNARLLSLGLDGIFPGLDPHEPISEAQVEKAAEGFGLTRDEVRVAYEELARQVPLKLSWQSGAKRKSSF